MKNCPNFPDGLLEQLRNDLDFLLSKFADRTKLSLSFDPYQSMRWSMEGGAFDEIQSEIADEVKGSGLPSAIKDQIADQKFDWSRPYRQELNTFISDTSLGECTRVSIAGATALRNSDHVDGPIKLALLEKILEAWTRIIQLGVIITPLMASRHEVTIENILFRISGEGPEEETDRYLNIVQCIPDSVFHQYEKDLSSKRLAPVFTRYLDSCVKAYLCASGATKCSDSGGGME